MAAVTFQDMTQVFLRTAYVCLGEMPENCFDTPKITVFVGCQKMNVYNFDVLSHDLIIFLQIYEIRVI